VLSIGLSNSNFEIRGVTGFKLSSLTISLLLCCSLLLCESRALADGSVQNASSKDSSISEDDWKVRQRKAHQDVVRGDGYAIANDFIQAVQCYQDAVTLLPNEAKFHFMLACAAWNAKDVDLASEHYSKAIQLNNNFAEAYFGLALCKEKIKEMDAAIAALKECVRLKPNFSNGVGWLQLGKAYDLVADDANAEKAYGMCLSASPVSASVIEEAKACLQKLKHKPKK
jgi:tetratricopeptide (TPR) repeat protein